MTDKDFKRASVSLSAFIIDQCRKFGLFPNENTTVLSRGDELQIMQFCLACRNKKNNESLEADSSITVKLVDKLKMSAIQSVEHSLLKVQKQEMNVPANKHMALHMLGDSLSEVDAVNGQCVNSSPTDCISTEELEDGPEHSVSEEASVLTLFHEYKDTNNHWTVMDVYSAFVKSVIDQASDLHQVIVGSEVVPKLECDMEGYCTMQAKVIGFLQSISCTAPSALQNGIVSSDVSEDIQLSSSGTSTHLLSPKTPVGKIKAASSCDKSPAQACVAMTTPKTPISPSSGRGLKEIFVEDVFRSYMHLLVNSRSQLALARVFNIPERGLDHEAFTHLKHEASACGLSMYQTLSSLMLRIHLGGQGYAPTKDNPLMAYVKGLGSLLDTTQKLHLIIEEESELSVACSRIVNLIKNNLLRCKSGRFPGKLVAPLSERICNTLTAIIQEMNSGNKDGCNQVICSGGRVWGQQCVMVIQQYLDRTALNESQLDLLLLSDIRFSSSSPTRFPCLLTQFRSPVIMDVKDEDCESKNKNCSISIVSGVNKLCVSAALGLDSKENSEVLLTQRTMNSIEIVPSKTIIHPKADVTGQASHKVTRANTGTSTFSNVNNKVTKCVKTKGGKRPAASSLDKENLMVSPLLHCPGQDKKLKQGESKMNSLEPSPKSSRATSSQEMAKSKKSVKSCRRRLLPQIKGQVKITGFFRL